MEYNDWLACCAPSREPKLTTDELPPSIVAIALPPRLSVTPYMMIELPVNVNCMLVFGPAVDLTEPM